MFYKETKYAFMLKSFEKYKLMWRRRKTSQKEIQMAWREIQKHCIKKYKWMWREIQMDVDLLISRRPMGDGWLPLPATKQT